MQHNRYLLTSNSEKKLNYAVTDPTRHPRSVCPGFPADGSEDVSLRIPSNGPDPFSNNFANFSKVFFEILFQMFYLHEEMRCHHYKVLSEHRNIHSFLCRK